jgi:hypothetical protein
MRHAYLLPEKALAVIWGLGTGSAQRWFDKLTNHGSTGSPTVVRQAHQPWFDRLTNRGSTRSPTVVRQGHQPWYGRLTNRGSAALTNHGSAGSPTVVRQAHQPPRVKKEGQSPLLFSQHAAFSIVWFSFREGGRTAVHP